MCVTSVGMYVCHQCRYVRARVCVHGVRCVCVHVCVCACVCPAHQYRHVCIWFPGNVAPNMTT